jgi:hypothetical protein
MYTLQDGLPEVNVSTISDQQLLEYLCQNRAVISYPRNDEEILLVEGLVPRRTVVNRSNPYLYSQEYAVVCLLADEYASASLAVMHTALIRDCLRGADRERHAQHAAVHPGLSQ